MTTFNKSLFFFAVLLISAQILWANPPQGIKYQALIRDANHELVVNSEVSIRVSILQHDENGPQVYSEEHSAGTNAYGLLEIVIGHGNPLSGNFSEIAWNEGSYFLKTETDPAGGNNFDLLSISEMLSVPFAFYAAETASIKDDFSGDYSDLDNLPDLDLLATINMKNERITNLGSPAGEQDAANKIYVDGNLDLIEERIEHIENTLGIDPLVVDYDGNIYQTVTIGTQVWMAENLRSVHYADGTPINEAYAYYHHNFPDEEENVANYGKLYTWDAVMNPGGSDKEDSGHIRGACPVGWHVPTHDEWNILTDFITGGTSTGGNQLKSCRQVNSPLGGDCATDEHPRWEAHHQNYGIDKYGFSALPGGMRGSSGLFSDMGLRGRWWAATEVGEVDAYYRFIFYDVPNVGVHHGDMRNAYSVRCVRDKPAAPRIPDVSTATPADITATTAMVGGFIEYDGGSEVTSHGVYFGTDPDPQTTGEKLPVGSGTGEFFTTLTELDNETEYYVAAFAINSMGTAVGEVKTFTTLLQDPELPTVITSEPSNITSNSSLVGGNVTNDGGSDVSEKGIYWSTEPNPETTGQQMPIGSGTGEFSSLLTGLESETTYYVKAYATSVLGSGFGEEFSFTTLDETGPGTVTDYDGNIYQTVTIGGREWMAENLRVTHYNNGDPIPNVEAGEEWEDLTSGAYSIYPYDDENASGIDSEEQMVEAYGKLYNWHTVNDERGLCPDGWHVPDNDEWTQLTDYLSGESDEVGKLLKSCRQVNSPLGGDCDTNVHPRWNAHEIHFGTDDYGFSGHAAGYRFANGNFVYLGERSAWWTSTESMAATARYRSLYYGNSSVSNITYNQKGGLSIRCVKSLD